MQFPFFSFSHFLVFVVVAILLIPHAFAQVVDIPDPNLRHAVRQSLNLADGISLTQQEMLRLTELHAIDKQITDLTGLEHATNLIWLRVPENNITDLTPLANSTQLIILELWVNPISDLSPIANLTRLERLDLGGCQVSDITPLTNLTQLTWLNIWWNQVQNIAPIAKLIRLTILRLSGNGIVDISPLANLTMLEELWIDSNQIIDYSPLDGLSLTRLEWDEICELPSLPIEPRIENRNLPSVFQPWGAQIINRPTLSHDDQVAHHDLYWHLNVFGLHFQETPQGYQLTGNLERAKAERDRLLAKNPNMLFLFEIRQKDAILNYHYPEDSPYWVRDEAGNLVPSWYDIGDLKLFLLDFTLPEVQDIIVQQAIAVAKCGLVDGIMFDWWSDTGILLTNWYDGTPYSTEEEEVQARLSFIQRIRAEVPDNFLIIANTNRHKIPITGPYINGLLLENVFDYGPYTHSRVIEIESTLLWAEENLREPQINCLEAWGIPTEPPDSPNNQQWMRLFTTMSLTLSNGYVLYTPGAGIGTVPSHRHAWYPFWDANLGQPAGPTAQRYQNIKGLYIREFTNGWAVYNRSGTSQTITLPTSTIPVSDRGNNAASQTHLLPDLDGEIYLKAKNPADVNGDGKVNILDLVQVANGFGRSTPDPNGDGVVNILDLVFVAQAFSQ